MSPPRHTGTPTIGPGSRAVNVKDVAALAGVSLGTVSNTLNRPQRVSPQTRARVERAMADLGFVRNESARHLRAGHSRTLAYVMLDAGNPFFTNVAQAIDQAAEAADLSLSMYNSDNRASRESTHLSLLLQQRVRGILITPVDPHSAELDAIADRGTPLVLVDRVRRDDRFCSVGVDDVLGGRLAVEHLVDVGHRRVAFVGGPLSIGQIADRWEGAQAAWSTAGLPLDDLVHIPCQALTVTEGRSAGERLVGLPARRRPSAAFCANDLAALGLLQQQIGAGRRVPDDLAILGYDDIDFAASAAVPLSSVRQPRHELGTIGAELILAESTDVEHQHRHVVLTPELVARVSTLG